MSVYLDRFLNVPPARLPEADASADTAGLLAGLQGTLDRHQQVNEAGGEMRTSMQKDFDSGRPLELDAIAGPIVRGGRPHGIATPATEDLVRLVEARLAASAV